MNETSPNTSRSDIPASFKPPRIGADHERREVKVPMRDGVALHTVVILPQGATRAGVVLDRTPYGASSLTQVTSSARAASCLHPLHSDLVRAGYVLVVQDVRGKHESEGEYLMNRPLRGPLNDAAIDHSTDAWDTMAWLVAHLPECNGRVATLGLSYDGFAALMSLIDPHPALAACVAIAPMVDTWAGDDWFHNGAFRQMPAAWYAYRQTTAKSSGIPWPALRHDEYETWLQAGSAGAAGRLLGLEQLPFWQRLMQHPDYDGHWRGQSLDKLLAGHELSVPTMLVHGLWDSEDIYGPLAAYAALDTNPANRDKTHVVIGPWSHVSTFFLDGAAHGPLRFGSDTARTFRQHQLLPFLDARLKDGAAATDLPRVHAFETGANRWLEYQGWPPEHSHPKCLFLQPGFQLSFDRPVDADDAGCDEFVSDPAKPVTYQPRPIRPKDAPGYAWERWLVEDQRFASDRPDVLTYTSDYLEQPLRLAGQPVVHLHASTSGSDVDWIVKLIDVQPDEVPGNETLGGYQLPLAMEILRARFRDDPSSPEPVPPGERVHYVIKLPHVSHALLPGHRLMLQIQCTWFPLYDRNPQTFVRNIMSATPADYVKATQRVYRGGAAATRVELPVLGGA